MKNTVNLTKTVGLLTKSNINFKEVVETGTGLAFPIMQTKANNDSYTWTLSDLTCLLAPEEKSNQLYILIEQNTNDTYDFMFTTLDDFADIATFMPSKEEFSEIKKILTHFKKITKDGTNKMIKTIKRDEITLDTDTLDTINTDFDSIENTVFIPLITKRIENTFKWFFGDEYDSDFLTLDSLFLVIEPIEGHNIYSFDGQYKYSIVSSSLFSLTKDIEKARKEINDITEEEETYIKRILWGHKSTIKTFFYLAESALSAKYPDIKFTRFAGDVGWDYCNNQWRGVFKTDNKYLIATTTDLKSNKPDFEFQLIG